MRITAFESFNYSPRHKEWGCPSFDEYPVSARVVAVSFAVVDVALKIIVSVANVAPPIGGAAANLFGMPFKSDYTLKDTLYYTESTLLRVVLIPVSVSMAPVHLFFQTARILISGQCGFPRVGKSFYPEWNTRISEAQVEIYDRLNAYSESNPFLGRLAGLPVCVLDVALNVVKAPIKAIWNIYAGICCLFSSSQYSWDNSPTYFQVAFASLVSIPVVLAMAPVKVFFQFSAMLINPTKVRSINFELRLDEDWLVTEYKQTFYGREYRKSTEPKQCYAYRCEYINPYSPPAIQEKTADFLYKQVP